MYALAIKNKDGQVVFVGAFKYKTIDAAIKAIPEAEKNRKQLQKEYPQVHWGPIVGVVDRKDNLVWKR